MIRSIVRLLALVCIGVCAAQSVGAQELVPRAYVITPTDSSAFILGYSQVAGGLEFAGGVPITGLEANFDLGVASYYHSLGVFGRSANFTISVPYGHGYVNADVFGAPKEAYRSGLLDVALRFAVNLIGGPEMSAKEFGKWQQNVLLGMSLSIVPPTGQYNSTVLINLGTNRWAFKPEIGYSERFGHWVLDAYLGGWFFTTNPEYFSRNMYFPGVQDQWESPLGEFETHLSYDFAPRLWVSADADFYWGGDTYTNGAQNPGTNQRNSRYGFTASVPLTRAQSVKFSYANGVYVRYGGNFRTFSVAWQYGWYGSF